MFPTWSFLDPFLGYSLKKETRNRINFQFYLDCDQMLGSELRVICRTPDVFVTVKNTKTYHQSLNSWAVIVIFQFTFFYKSLKECYDGPVQWNLWIITCCFLCVWFDVVYLFVSIKQHVIFILMDAGSNCRQLNADHSKRTEVFRNHEITKRWKKNLHPYHGLDSVRLISMQDCI